MFSLLSKNGSILSRASASPIDYVLGKSSRSSLAAHNLGARLTNPVIRSLLPISLSRKTEKGGRKRSIFYLEPKLICAKDLRFPENWEFFQEVFKAEKSDSITSYDHSFHALPLSYQYRMAWKI